MENIILVTLTKLSREDAEYQVQFKITVVADRKLF